MLNIPTLEFLGSTKLGSAAASSSVITIPARDILWLLIRITGYAGGGDIATVRFNGDSTAANYHDRHITFSRASSTTTAAAAVEHTTGGFIVTGPAATTLGRVTEFIITNNSATRKVCQIRQQEESSAQATPVALDLAYGQWFNTAAQITSIQLLTNAGGNMNAGSGFMVYGRNL